MIPVSIRGKLISELSPADVHELIDQRAPEDIFLEFRREILDKRKPQKKLHEDEEDWIAYLVAFANAQGGHVIIGLEADAQERASRLRPMAGDQAGELATRLRDLAIAHIKPPIQLEIARFRMTEEDWLVIARIPESQDKPHMYTYREKGQTRFTIRDGSTKRAMAYEEIQRLFLAGPQQQLLIRFQSEIGAINARLDALVSVLERTPGKVN